MAITYSFADRFSYPSPDGITPDISADVAQTLSDADIEAASPDLAIMADMVRSHSVLLKRTRTLEIFNIITRQSDPRVALIVASARRKTNNLALFHGLDEVQRVMFNDPNRSPQTNETLNTSLFSDGIRRVSAALCAAIILGQLPDVQREYANQIEASALLDLEKVVSTYELSDSLQPDTDKTAQPAPTAFYFEPMDMTLADNEVLAVEWYSPSFTTRWVPVQTYTGQVSTWNVVSDLADAINIYTSLNVDASLLAVAELSGPVINSNYLHTLSFYPRKPLNGILGYSINVKIEKRVNTESADPVLVIGGTTADPAQHTTPFKWGPHALSIKNYPINGSIIVLYFDKASALTPSELSNSYAPIVLYFRNKVTYVPDGDIPKDKQKLVYRLQPWQPALAAINNQPIQLEQTFDRLVDGDLDTQLDLDNSRFSQIALELLNGLAEVNLETKAAGCIIRNDSTSQPRAIAGLELIAWGLSKAMSHIILDILEIPDDIEMATGNLVGPTSSFSNKPRTVRVSVKNESFLNALGGEVGNTRDSIRLVPKQPTRIWQSILDEQASVDEPRYY